VARHYDTLTAPWLLFAGIFSIAAAFRFLSSLSMTRQVEVLVLEEKPTHSVLDMHLFQPPRGLTSFALATALFQGIANLAGPFFNVWYLGDLHFSYLSLAIATASTVLGSILALRLWGRLADRKGNLWVLRFSAFLIGFIPLPYLFLHQPAYLWCVNVFGGAVWAGYNLANFNCILAATGKHRQSQAIAFVALITGISMTFFGVLGGWLSVHIPILFTWRLQSMFLLSALLRFACWVLLISRLRLPAKA
jgi:MFS family permease